MVAIDGSKESMHAANCAIGVAKSDAILVVLTVLPQELRYDYEIDQVDPEVPMTPVKGVVISNGDRRRAVYRHQKKCFSK